MSERLHFISVLEQVFRRKKRPDIPKGNPSHIKPPQEQFPPLKPHRQPNKRDRRRRK